VTVSGKCPLPFDRPSPQKWPSNGSALALHISQKGSDLRGAPPTFKGFVPYHRMGEDLRVFSCGPLPRRLDRNPAGSPSRNRDIYRQRVPILQHGATKSGEADWTESNRLRSLVSGNYPDARVWPGWPLMSTGTGRPVDRLSDRRWGNALAAEPIPNHFAKPIGLPGPRPMLLKQHTSKAGCGGRI
jgi:hypothetical protein